MTSFDPRAGNDFEKAVQQAAGEASRRIAVAGAILLGVLALLWLAAWNWGLS